jgi:bifunctional ADP-heptose synthase (sugar kinase/adenylyltransferase)
LDLESIRAAGDAVNTREKIVTVAALGERVKESANSGARIVLAWGRFDLLSRELVEELRAARKGDVVLVVAIEPNPGRDCLLPAEARAQLAAGLAAVDFVAVASQKEVQLILSPAETIEVKSDLAPRLLARFRGPARA